MADALNYLLSHTLDTNENAAVHAHRVAEQVASSALIAICERADGTDGPVMHRWSLRLASLIASSAPARVRAGGLRLEHVTLLASTAHLLTHGKHVLATAHNIVATAASSKTAATTPSSPSSSKAHDPALVLAATDVLALILARSTVHPEWARDAVGAQTVQKITHSLVALASSDAFEQIQSSVIDTLVALVPLFTTALRPLSNSLHTLAIETLCKPDATKATLQAGARLFAVLYQLAPKGRDGLRDAWRKGTEALVASIDRLVPFLTSGIFAEDPLTNDTLVALAVPNLHEPSVSAGLARAEAFSLTLCTVLRTPTSERTGSVQVPVGAIVELGCRLAGLNTETPTKERTDPAVITATHALLPRLQTMGCQILAQLAMCLGPAASAHGSEILATLTRSLATFEPHSPMRAAFCTSASIVISSLGSSLDPDEGRKTLPKVWRVVLEDIGAAALDPVMPPTANGKEGGATASTSRKAKKQKTYDASESMQERRVQVDEVDLELAQQALSNLERLLSSPLSHFLPPKLNLSTARLLLFLSLDPSFFTTHPQSTTASTSFFVATSAVRAIDIVKQDVDFRRSVVKCLQIMTAENISRLPDGVVDRVVQVFKLGLRDSDVAVQSLCSSTLSVLTNTIHPIVPPLQVNSAFLKQKQLDVGGAVGDDQDVERGASEFAPKLVQNSGEHVGMDEMQAESDNDDGVGSTGQDLKRKQSSGVQDAAAAARVNGDKSAATVPDKVVPSLLSGRFGAQTGFGSNAFAKSLNGTAHVDPPMPAVPRVEQESEARAVDESAGQGSEGATRVPGFGRQSEEQVPLRQTAAGGEDEQDSDDDEAMPTIHMDSDDE
ncbi:hypothetical protein OIV83_002478 [Microbotryomycetes sp. JL201]|nr:hypothetical protein OIV83_002478 [Microbotryomycetes sp. JL201]